MKPNHIAKFEQGRADAFSINYENYTEAYEVFVYSECIMHDWDCIMKTIDWGNKQGFTVLNSNRKKLHSVPSPLADKGNYTQKFVFVKNPIVA